MLVSTLMRQGPVFLVKGGNLEILESHQWVHKVKKEIKVYEEEMVSIYGITPKQQMRKEYWKNGLFCQMMGHRCGLFDL